MNTPLFGPFSRRQALKNITCGFGYLAFASLATRAAQKGNPLSAKEPQFPARAKHVIFLCMSGGVSHVDTFDYKPKLSTDSGKSAVSVRGRGVLMGSPWKFKQYGQAGQWVSELFPEVAKHVDDLCIIKSMQTDIPAHPPAFLQMHTGSFQFVRPSMGAWTLYGLGTENENLPGFITLNAPVNNGGAQNFGSSFLPAIYQGTRIGFEGRPVAQARIQNITNSELTSGDQRAQLDFIQSLNRQRLERDQFNPQIEGVIESNELAFRMQAEVPKVMDISRETEATKKMYGIDGSSTDDFGRQCLLARRFVEAGVRFVEVCKGGWDQHFRLKADHAKNAESVDQPIAALLSDLKTRGLLKDTLVIFGSEFGRTPAAQNNDGRDHNSRGYTMWMAGGGVKPGISYGQTDEYGSEAVENKVHIHDFHATMLHLMGLNHEKLTYRFAGRDFRLTDISGNVVKDIIA